MSNELWKSVDHFLESTLVCEDDALKAAVRAGDEAGMPPIGVAPCHGKLLNLLVRLRGARRILEIGTLAGYSTIWMARGMPAGGKLTTIEFERKHAEVARANFSRAGVDDRVEILVGAALDVLPGLDSERFDFAFIDADKINGSNYFAWAVAHANPGCVVVVDNVIRNGAILQPGAEDESALGSRRVLETIGARSGVDSTAVQTVGVKGYDGFSISIVE